MDSGEKIAWEQELWDEFAADRYAAAQSDGDELLELVEFEHGDFLLHYASTL